MKPFLWLIVILEALWNVGLLAQSQPPARASVTPVDLPVIYLEAKGPIASESKVPCTVRMILPGDSKPGPVLKGVVRIHGASSQGFPKQSFGITLDEPAGWLGMRESAHWVLNAAFIDRSLMRHKLSYDLFTSLSRTNAPRYAAASRFVEVAMGGNYRGVYLLMERVNRALLKLQSYSTNAPQHASLYKAVDHAATFDRPGHDGFQQREPEPLLHGEYWGPLEQLNRFVSSSTVKDFLDPVKGIAARLDLNNAIDFHLLILLTSNMDGFDKNLLLARDAPTDKVPAPRFFFVPWDYDATFGRNWDGSRVGPRHWLSNSLFDRLLADPAYRGRFAARWTELRQREFSEQNISRMIDENAATLRTGAQRNAARWRTGDRLSFEDDIAQMKQWIAQRTQWLDQEIARRNTR